MRGQRHEAIFGAVNILPISRWRRALRPGGRIVTVNPLFENGVLGWSVRSFARVRLEGVLVRPSGADPRTVGAWISG